MQLGWPTDFSWYRLLTDWGSFIGGLLALAAGIVAYRGALAAAEQQNAGTMAAADKQIREMRRTERLRARGIAVAVYPELLESKAAVDERRTNVSMGFSPSNAESKAAFLGKMYLPLLPFMERNITSFYLLEPGASRLIRTVTLMRQYNRMVEEIDDNAWPLNEKLLALRQALTDAIKDVEFLQDEAGKNASIGEDDQSRR
jgi:hypothetical protein